MPRARRLSASASGIIPRRRAAELSARAASSLASPLASIIITHGNLKMHESPYPARRFDPDRPSGTELILGNVAKISDAVSSTRVALAKLEATTNAALADLERRIAAVLAATKAALADADRRDALRRGRRP